MIEKFQNETQKFYKKNLENGNIHQPCDKILPGTNLKYSKHSWS